MNEENKFLEELDIKQEETLDSILDKPLDVPAEKEETEEESEFKAKNRRERRLNERLQAEREANIALNARIQGITEAQDLRKTTEEADYLKRVEKIYGTATPEAKEATELLKEALQGVHQSAREDAERQILSRLEEERRKETEEVTREEDFIENNLEKLEDEFGADFGNQTNRKEFLTLVERLSPKDEEGNIKEFADFSTAYEIYSRNKTSSRAKDLASRSMIRGGATDGSKLQEDTAIRFLKDNGII